jgi:hypothetical protein
VTNNEFATIRDVLARLEGKIRRAWTIRGLAYAGAALCVAAVFSFLLDYFLDLPLAVRAVHLVVMLAGVFLVARWALFAPLRTKTTELDLAQAVEHGAPELRDRLVSALDFEKRLGDRSDPESTELMADVVRDAAAHASRIDPGLLVDVRPVRRAASIAAAAAIVLGAVALALPDDFALWLSRGVLLRGIPWPRRTHIRVLDFPADGPKIVTRGEDLRVVAQADGEHPSELVLHYEELAEPDPSKGPDAAPVVTFVETRRMYALEGEEGRHAFDFHAVSASFRFWVTGGDDQDEEPVYSVLALVPPRVASIAGKIVYPQYAGLPDADVKDASFETLAGSHVELTITANMPLASARIVPTDAAAPTNVALGDDKKSMVLKFDVDKSVDFHLELTAARGHTNRPDDDVFHIRATDDRPPELRVLYPPSRLYRTPRGIVPIKLVAKDDFRVEKVSLDLTLGTTPVGGADLWPVPGAPAPADRRRVDSYQPLDLDKFGGGDGVGKNGSALKPGDVLHLLVHAVDSHGNDTSSGDLAVETLSPEDFERRLSQKQGTLREDLQVVIRNQNRARGAIRDLRDSVAKSSADPAAVDRGRNLQVDNGRVGADLVQFLNGIHQVFDAYVLDRVGADATIDKLLPLYHEALAKRSDEEVFPASLYKKIVEEKRADRVYDPEILGALLDIMDLGDRATTEVSPAVYKALSTFAGEGAHDKADLERAEKSAGELGAILAEIDQKMQRWGELSLLIEMARVIRDTQGQLSKDPAGTKGLAPK